MCVCVCVCVCVRARVCAGVECVFVVYKEFIQYYDYVMIIFEVLMCTFLLIL